MITIDKLSLRKARILAGLTQAEVAKEVNVTVRTIHRWEAGEAYPTVDVFSDLCECYGVSMNDIDLLRPESKL